MYLTAFMSDTELTQSARRKEYRQLYSLYLSVPAPPAPVELRADAIHVGRPGDRNRTRLLLASRHGLRVSEVVALRGDSVDVTAGRWTSWAYERVPSRHPLRGDEAPDPRVSSERHPGITSPPL